MNIKVNQDSIFYKLGRLRGYLENVKSEKDFDDDVRFENYFLDLVDELEEHFLQELCSEIRSEIHNI